MGFVVLFPASLIEEESTVGLARLLILCGTDPIMSQLALNRRAEIY